MRVACGYQAAARERTDAAPLRIISLKFPGKTNLSQDLQKQNLSLVLRLVLPNFRRYGASNRIWRTQSRILVLMASTDPPGAERRRPAPPLPSPIVHLSFSSDASCFVVAGTSSVHWLSCDTFGLRGLYQERDARKAIVAAAGDMLSLKESACATVSRVDSTKFFIRRWKPGYMNYHWRYFEGEKTYSGGEDDVRAVRVHGTKTVVVLVGRLEVLSCRTKDTDDKELWLLHSVVTGGNPLGLYAVSSGAPFAFACPATRDGEVHVERWEDEGEVTPPVVAIRAHSSRLASIAMSCNGRLVATASVRGTLVRIFSATDGALLQEVSGGA